MISISRFSAPSLPPPMGTASSRRRAQARAPAALSALATALGGAPSSTKGFTARSSSPASSTTVVVPSPASASCDRATSTSSEAAGCTTSSRRMIVAPSVEIVTLPRSSWISLSMPRGPRVVRTTSASAAQALMLETSCGLPWEVSVPSRRRRIWGCCCCRCGEGGRRGGWGWRKREEEVEKEKRRLRQRERKKRETIGRDDGDDRCLLHRSISRASRFPRSRPWPFSPQGTELTIIACCILVGAQRRWKSRERKSAGREQKESDAGGVVFDGRSEKSSAQATDKRAEALCTLSI